MCLYSNNSVSVRLRYSFTGHHLKAKLFTLILSMYRETCDSDCVGNKMQSKILKHFLEVKLFTG